MTGGCVRYVGRCGREVRRGGRLVGRCVRGGAVVLGGGVVRGGAVVVWVLEEPPTVAVFVGWAGGVWVAVAVSVGDWLGEADGVVSVPPGPGSVVAPDGEVVGVTDGVGDGIGSNAGMSNAGTGSGNRGGLPSGVSETPRKLSILASGYKSTSQTPATPRKKCHVSPGPAVIPPIVVITPLGGSKSSPAEAKGAP